MPVQVCIVMAQSSAQVLHSKAGAMPVLLGAQALFSDLVVMQMLGLAGTADIVI